uniref:Uncharacterized protein n=1 Tax=Coccolithus braarudii TaxID=221442 RepID=A0A7S0LGL0_9EUKA
MLAFGAENGDIIVCDPRKAGGDDGAAALLGESSHLTPIDGHKSSLSSLALHPEVPLLASASRNQLIKLFDLGRGRELGTIRYFDGFLGARIGPVSCLAFHPTKKMLATGSFESTLCIYSAPD